MSFLREKHQNRRALYRLRRSTKIRCLVLETLNTKTARGDWNLKPGEIITFSVVKAQKLIEMWVIGLCDDAAPEKAFWNPPSCGYLIFYEPEILGDAFLLTDTEARAEVLRESGIVDVIYTSKEMRRLVGLSPDALRACHVIKKNFPGSKIE